MDMTHENQIKEIIEELGRADIIITAMLNAMTLDQKRLVAEQLLLSGVSPGGMTRANEREAILKKYS